MWFIDTRSDASANGTITHRRDFAISCDRSESFIATIDSSHFSRIRISGEMSVFGVQFAHYLTPTAARPINNADAHRRRRRRRRFASPRFTEHRGDVRPNNRRVINGRW